MDLAGVAGRVDEGRLSAQDRADRSGQPLGDAEHHRIDLLHQLGGGHTLSDRGVEQAGAVAVHAHAGRVGGAGHGVHLIGGHRAAAGVVVGVLDTEQQRLGPRVGGDRPLHVLGGEHAPLGVHRGRLDREQRPSETVAVTGEHVRMRLVHGQRRPAAAGTGADLQVGDQGSAVAHAAARHVQGRFLAEPLGGHRLQPLDGRIVAEGVVAHLGGVHGLPHPIGGMGEGVAAQVHGRIGLHRIPPQASISISCTIRSCSGEKRGSRSPRATWINSSRSPT